MSRRDFLKRVYKVIAASVSAAALCICLCLYLCLFIVCSFFVNFMFLSTVAESSMFGRDFLKRVYKVMAASFFEAFV